MALALPFTAAGVRRHRVLLSTPSDVSDGQGGWVPGWADLTPPDWWVSIESPSARDLERLQAGSVISSATRILRGRYRSDVTMPTRVTFGARVFDVNAINTVDENQRWLELVCTEQVA